jgi:hypothetical protein
MWPFTILAGPAAVLLSIWKWKQPLSLVRRTHWRMVLGMILGLAETGAWVMGIILYLGYRSRR